MHARHTLRTQSQEPHAGCRIQGVAFHLMIQLHITLLSGQSTTLLADAAIQVEALRKQTSEELQAGCSRC